MTICIVDRLEVIRVDIGHMADAPCVNARLHLFDKSAPVQQTCQSIKTCKIFGVAVRAFCQIALHNKTCSGNCEDCGTEQRKCQPKPYKSGGIRACHLRDINLVLHVTKLLRLRPQKWHDDARNGICAHVVPCQAL